MISLLSLRLRKLLGIIVLVYLVPICHMIYFCLLLFGFGVGLPIESRKEQEESQRVSQAKRRHPLRVTTVDNTHKDTMD